MPPTRRWLVMRIWLRTGVPVLAAAVVVSVAIATGQGSGPKPPGPGAGAGAGPGGQRHQARVVRELRRHAGGPSSPDRQERRPVWDRPAELHAAQCRGLHCQGRSRRTVGRRCCPRSLHDERARSRSGRTRHRQVRRQPHRDGEQPRRASSHRHRDAQGHRQRRADHPGPGMGTGRPAAPRRPSPRHIARRVHRSEGPGR